MEIDLKSRRGSTIGLKPSPGEATSSTELPKVDKQNPKTILRKVSHLRMHKVEQLIHGKGLPPKASLDEKVDKVEMVEGVNGVEVKLDDTTTAVITYNNIPLYHVKADD